KAAQRATEIGATAVQIFTDNPTAWRRKEVPTQELVAFREHLASAGIGPLAVHAPYLVNLCGPNEDFWAKSVATMATELTVGATYGASFVVMHIGSHRGLERAEGIERMARGICQVLDAAEAQSGGRVPLPRLVLENAAGTGDGIGATLEDLADMLAAAEAAGASRDRLGVCLDTAHLWGAGYDIGGQDGVEALVTRIDALLGREQVVMVHLNDSRTTLGSHRDRHEHIGAGKVGQDGLRELLTHPWLATLPTYLETPGMDLGYDRINLERALALIHGERLRDLPPEAFEMRRGRSLSRPAKG
ncbi:MAG: deoxyribonuclease IV, partial [Chloroflexota bacterium]